MRKTFTPAQKAAVALAALKGDQTINQISSLHEVHPTQIKQWEKIAKEELPGLFTDKRSTHNKEQQALIDELYRIIGQRDTELAWLKKKLQLEP